HGGDANDKKKAAHTCERHVGAIARFNEVKHGGDAESQGHEDQQRADNEDDHCDGILRRDIASPFPQISDIGAHYLPASGGHQKNPPKKPSFNPKEGAAFQPLERHWIRTQEVRIQSRSRGWNAAPSFGLNEGLDRKSTPSELQSQSNIVCRL